MAQSNLKMFDYIDEQLCQNPEHYFTYKEILEGYRGYPFAKNEVIRSDRKMYQSLLDAIQSIETKLSRHDYALELVNPKNRGKGFRYPQGVEDPLRLEKTEHKKLRVKQFERLISASTGLFPRTWIADMVEGFQTISSDKKGIIHFDQNLHLEHLQWIPTLFDAIENKKVVKFCYNPGYGEKKHEVFLHPYLLKEYNQRWFVFGHATDAEGKPTAYSTCAIDRIVGNIEEAYKYNYIEPKNDHLLQSHFADIVGVKKPRKKKPIPIEIAVNDPQTYGRIATKKIHPKSQRPVECFEHDIKKRKGFIITVIPNDELDTLLMSYGPGIEILNPKDYRNKIAEKIKKMADQYGGEKTYPSET